MFQKEPEPEICEIMAEGEAFIDKDYEFNFQLVMLRLMVSSQCYFLYRGLNKKV